MWLQLTLSLRCVLHCYIWYRHFSVLGGDPIYGKRTVEFVAKYCVVGHDILIHVIMDRIQGVTTLLLSDIGIIMLHSFSLYLSKQFHCDSKSFLLHPSYYNHLTWVFCLPHIRVYTTLIYCSEVIIMCFGVCFSLFILKSSFRRSTFRRQYDNMITHSLWRNRRKWMSCFISWVASSLLVMFY